MLRGWRRRCQEVGAQLLVVPVPLPLAGAEDLLQALDAAAPERVAVLHVSAISSSAALALPTSRLAAWGACPRRRGRGGRRQSKNILLGPEDRWQAIDPFTSRGDLNAEAALWAVVQDDGSTIDQRITQLTDSTPLPTRHHC
jgi:hypothetical protein